MRTLVLLAAIGCGSSSSSPIAVTSWMSGPPHRAVPMNTAGEATFRVMSYNVNFGLAGDPQGAAAIAAGAPDVVVLQETNEPWEGALVAALPQFAYHRFGAPQRLPAGGMGVMSRYPIASVEQLDAVGGPFFAWRIVIDAPSGRMQILDVHLRPPMSDGGSWVVGYFSTRGDREREMEWHASRLDHSLPTLIAGDFNEEADGRAVAVAERLGFADAITQFTNTRTWEWPVGDFTLHFQLDHVMYDSHFIALRAGIVEAGRSDHKPVWVDLERATD